MEAVMPKDAPPNGGAPTGVGSMGPHRRVSEMQVKLHRWAAADPGRRFDDLFNLVHDPATLLVAFERVAGNTGARTPGVDGLSPDPPIGGRVGRVVTCECPCETGGLDLRQLDPTSSKGASDKCKHRTRYPRFSMTRT